MIYCIKIYKSLNKMKKNIHNKIVLGFMNGAEFIN